MAENIVADFIEKGIHHRTSYSWKCCYDVHLSVIELIKVKKVKPFRFFFLFFSPFFVIMPKHWVDRTTLNEEKKGGCPFNIVIWLPRSIKVTRPGSSVY